ncbi:patatin-like phospholipase family protein [Streptomyces koelreuteriae]|uniref:patatin-like phospholipase family protein n=1 Tax=Streptomyces koelreuteriae TaxID=2838015 RepID=UPI003EBD2A4F
MTGLDDLAAAARRTAAGRADSVPEVTRVEQLIPAPSVSGAIRPRIGLVLSGGGAKGAYHVGVVECLASAGVHIDAVAGTSIGALNGAVLACAGNLQQGAVALRAIWDEVAAYSAAPGGSGAVADVLGVPVEETTWEQLGKLLPRLTGRVLRPSYLEGIVATHVDPGRLDGGTPLWVSAFPRWRNSAYRTTGAGPSTSSAPEPAHARNGCTSTRCRRSNVSRPCWPVPHSLSSCPHGGWTGGSSGTAVSPTTLR